MTGFEKKKIIRSLVTLEKILILTDDFLELSLKKLFSQRMLNNIKRSESSSLEHYIKHPLKVLES